MTEKKFKPEEAAILVGISVKTLNIWYKFKAENPDNEYAKMLPDFERIGAKGTRYWTQDDIYKLIEFQSAIPQGRNGIMGDVTRPYWKYTTEKRREDAKRRKSEM